MPWSHFFSRNKRKLGRIISGKALPAYTYRWDKRELANIRADGFMPWNFISLYLVQIGIIMKKCKLCCKLVSEVYFSGCCSDCNGLLNPKIYDCDGDNCANKVRFRIASDKLEIGNLNTETFKIADVISKFNELFLEIGITADAKTGVPEIFSLCPECWTGVSSTWTGSDYGTVPGKCVSKGFYFNASRPGYLKNGDVWLDKVRSTAVHELMHWQSKAEKGLQDYSTEWDECITDALGREVYFRLGHTNYESGYGNLTQFCKLAADAYMKNYTSTTTKTEWKRKRMEGKPAAIKNTLDKLYKTDGSYDESKERPVKNELIDLIFKIFATYHNKGPSTMIDGDNFATFLQKFKPDGMANLSFGFKTYTS